MDEQDQGWVFQVAAVLALLGVPGQDEPEFYCLGADGAPEQVSLGLLGSGSEGAGAEHEPLLRKAS